MPHSRSAPAAVSLACLLFACGAGRIQTGAADRASPAQSLLVTLRDALDHARADTLPDAALLRTSLAPLSGLSRDRIETALGSPTRCPPFCLPIPPARPANPRDQVFYFASEPRAESGCIPCSVDRDEFYEFEGGVLLLLHFDAAARCAAAEWIAPRMIE